MVCRWVLDETFNQFQLLATIRHLYTGTKQKDLLRPRLWHVCRALSYKAPDQRGQRTALSSAVSDANYSVITQPFPLCSNATISGKDSTDKHSRRTCRKHKNPAYPDSSEASREMHKQAGHSLRQHSKDREGQTFRLEVTHSLKSHWLWKMTMPPSQ